tara:strand:- start:412 stop:1254 length:843 start_codon:yes stop_codon:yes gene_type:complete
MKDLSLQDRVYNLQLVSKKTENHRSVFDINKVTVGESLLTIAGPCRVENIEQAHKIASHLSSKGVKFFRAGAFKPCTFPNADTGLGKQGLDILKEIKENYGMGIVTEAMSMDQVSPVAEVADIIQVGARNMQNYNLLQTIAQTGKPVLLKRHPGATLRDFLGAAEWVMANGSNKVILCDRGINSFATHDVNSRWLADITMIPAVRKYSHLPIIIDPSHACGIREFVPSIAKASVAAGADGTIIEVHYDPDKSVSDPLQAIDFKTFDLLNEDMHQIRAAIT